MLRLWGIRIQMIQFGHLTPPTTELIIALIFKRARKGGIMFRRVLLVFLASLMLTLPLLYACGSRAPAAPVEGYAHANSWWADAEMSDEIVYEIAKCIYENAKDGQLVTQKTIARISVPEGLFHPGALKFYKDRGIKPGIN